MTRISEEELERLREITATHTGGVVMRQWKALAIMDELRERRANSISIDDYEAVNLLWLLRIARTIDLDTGDWLGQLLFKLEKRGHASVRDPNSGPQDTQFRLLLAARRLLAQGEKP